jgi:hypothetical protein
MKWDMLRKAACFLISAIIILGYVRIVQAEDLGAFTLNADGTVTNPRGVPWLIGNVGDSFEMYVALDASEAYWEIDDPNGTPIKGDWLAPGEGTGYSTAGWAPGTYRIIVEPKTGPIQYVYLTLHSPYGSVGGSVVPVDKFVLLAPYIGLASTTMIGAVASAVYVRGVKRRKEKQ